MSRDRVHEPIHHHESDKMRTPSALHESDKMRTPSAHLVDDQAGSSAISHLTDDQIAAMTAGARQTTVRQRRSPGRTEATAT